MKRNCSRRSSNQLLVGLSSHGSSFLTPSPDSGEAVCFGTVVSGKEDPPSVREAGRNLPVGSYLRELLREPGVTSTRPGLMGRHRSLGHRAAAQRVGGRAGAHDTAQRAGTQRCSTEGRGTHCSTAESYPQPHRLRCVSSPTLGRSAILHRLGGIRQGKSPAHDNEDSQPPSPAGGRLWGKVVVTLAACPASGGSCFGGAQGTTVEDTESVRMGLQPRP